MNYQKTRRRLEKETRRCFYCGKNLDKNNGTIDHIRAYSKSRNNTAANKVFACRECNSFKADLSFAQISEKINNRLRFCKNTAEISRLTKMKRNYETAAKRIKKGDFTAA